MSEAKKVLVKTVQFYKGVELMGSVSSAQSRNNEIEALPHGVMITSRKSGRQVVVPFANVTAYELLPETPDQKQPTSPKNDPAHKPQVSKTQAKAQVTQ